MKNNKDTIKNIFTFIEKLTIVLCIAVLIHTVIVSILIVWFGNFAFWYDPARDLLLALVNIHKPTLIGPPSGIPGLFYGPYWIWLLSLGIVVSKDPRFVLFLVGIIPYVFLFPLIFFKFSKIFDKSIILALLVFFTLGSFFSYATALWNPNLAPFFFLFLAVLIITTSLSMRSFTLSFFSFVIGIVVGLILNFHLSFGVGVFAGTSFYVFCFCNMLFIRQKSKSTHTIFKSILIFITYWIGIALIFIPFIFFEFRHNFLQTREIYKTITDTVLYNTVEVGQHGFDKFFTFRTFVGTFGQTIKIDEAFVYIAFIIFQIYIFFLRKKGTFGKFITSLKHQPGSGQRLKLFAFLVLVLSSIFLSYISSKNPIWAYHFIGLDILFLLLTGIIMSVFPKIKTLLFIWLILLVVINVPNYYQSFKNALAVNTKIASLTMKKRVVQEIYQDAHGKPFLVAAYDPAIYTYDFDYVFAWIGNKRLTTNPKVVLASNQPIYLIVPRKQPAARLDFLHYMSTPSAFITTKIWNVGDDTQIIKREKKQQ